MLWLLTTYRVLYAFNLFICRTFYVQHRKELRNARKNALQAEEKKDADLNKIKISFFNPDVIDKGDNNKIDVVNNVIKTDSIETNKKET